MGAEREPLVSVVVPVFNVVGHVAEAIASLRAQTLADFEALIVDDGSTDGSGAVALAAIGEDPRFRLIQQPNRGLSGARNTGIAAARGEFLAFLDGDDAYAPEFLERLHGAIRREGTDWAACGIALVFPDGSESAHPALHASPDPGPARRLALTDAREVARVFPSAWNKLYRRTLFDGLLYPEGSWFEDHEVFWTLAALSPALAYLPDPLYRHRRDRPGQITGTDSDRVFEQLRVLDRLQPLILSSGLSHAAEGYARLATRLLHERALVIRDPARRTRFLTAAWALLDRQGADWSPDWDPEISRGLGLAMRGELPLSVVVLGDPGAAAVALGEQSLRDLERVAVGARGQDPAFRHLDPRGLTPARLAGAVTGRWVLLLAPGEVPLPEAAMRLVNLAEREGVSLAMGALQRPGAGYHDGWTDNRVLPGLDALPALGGRLTLQPGQALRLYPALGNRVIRRDLLATLPEALRLQGDATAVQLLALETALAAGAVGYTRLPVLSVPDRPRQPGGALAVWRALRLLPPRPELPRGWRGMLLFRIVQLGGGTGQRVLALGLALLSGWAPASPAGRADPGTPRWLRLLLRPFQGRG